MPKEEYLMKKLVSLLLVLAMVFAMASFASADEENTIIVYHYMVEGQKADALEEIEGRFAALHPELNIKWDNRAISQGGSPNYFDALNTGILAGEDITLMMGNPGTYVDLINEGYVLDLTGDPAVMSMGLGAADLADAGLDGHLYAYPVDFKSWGAFYNTKMFAENGWTVPTTKTEMLELCQKIADAGITPWANWYADGASVDIENRIVIWTKAVADGQLDMYVKLMNGEAKIADYPYFKEAIEYWGERLGAGKGWARPDAVSNDQTAGNEVFISGQAAMLFQGTWNIGTIEQKIAGSDFEYGFFVVPMDDAGTSYLNTQVDQAFMVNAKSSHVEIGKAFMEYWLGNEMGFWSDATYQPCITGATTENTVPLLKSLLDAKAAGNTSGYGNFDRQLTSAFIGAFRKALTAYATWACTGVETSGVHDADSCIVYMQELFDEEIAQAAL